MTSASTLHRAVWRNDAEGVAQCLAQEPAQLERRDSESGWTPLHSALYFGHVSLAAQLLARGARLEALDDAGRTPLDLVLTVDGDIRTEVFSWGSGTNFQLGTGSAEAQQTPRRVEKLQSGSVRQLAASKFHSMALTREDEVYTWGWGLGGRLGHPEKELHGENGAQIFPRLVKGLAAVSVRSIAAAKHHCVAVTTTGDVYSWGCARDGRLGYTAGAGNKQATPKRIAALKAVHAVSAAATNKHSAVVTDSGAVYTWGGNVHGQLGYGTSDSVSSPAPQCVEALKHKVVQELSLSKYHSLALTQDGEIFTWGHKGVAPKRVSLSASREEEAKNRAGQPIHFHRGLQKVKKPIAKALAAGVTLSCCLTTTGVVLCWKSAAPQSTVREVHGELAGKRVVSVSAGKEAMAAVVDDGRLFYWKTDGKKDACVPRQVPGMRNACAVAVGEKHSLVMQKWNGAASAKEASDAESVSSDASRSVNAISAFLSIQANRFSFEDESNKAAANVGEKDGAKEEVPSLQRLCERAVAQHVVDPRNVLALMRCADTIGASLLKERCLQIIVYNLGLVLHESHEILPFLHEDLLQEIEQSYQKNVLQVNKTSSGDWWLKGDQADSEVEMCELRPTYRLRSGSAPSSPTRTGSASLERSSSAGTATTNRFLSDQKRIQKTRQNMQKKLQQIKILFERASNGERLDTCQKAKMARRGIYQKALDAIESGSSYDEVQLILMQNTPAEIPEIKEQPSPSQKSRSTESKEAPLEPNLRPFVTQVRKSRDIGHMPRFLEPSRQKKVNGGTSPLDSDADQETSFPELPIGEKKWATLKLQKSQSSFKAIPTKETRKMSLSDFMTAPEPPPPVKDSGPAWGGVRFRDQPSFQSIQEEQRTRRPGMRVAEGVIKPAVETRRTVSRWHMHCDVQIQSIHAIQTEEKAVQELSALFKGATVRVKTGTAREVTKSAEHKR